MYSPLFSQHFVARRFIRARKRVKCILNEARRDCKGQGYAMTRFHNRQVRRHSQIYSATVFERLDRVKTSHSMQLGPRIQIKVHININGL